MRTPVGVLGGTVALVIALAMAWPQPATAQSEPPYDPAIEVQLFDYVVGPKSFLTVHDGQIADPKQFSIDFLLTFLTNPFTVYDYDENQDQISGERTRVVESMLAGQLNGAYGLTPSLQLGVSLPLVFSMSGDGLNPVDAMPSSDGLQATGLGDLRVEAKSRLWQRDRVRVAGIAGLTLPTSFGAGGSDYLGDDLPSARARAAASWRSGDGKLGAGANLGLILRKPREIYSSTVGQQLTYGAAAAYEINERVGVVSELFGRVGLTNLDVDSSPLEANGGLRVRATQSVQVLLGGGAGVVRGIGSPGLRVFVSVGYAPDYRDSDGDGLPNLRDKCPLQAEDFDGFQDSDGCPDPDNDGDLRSDDEDECPNEPEDLDGFQDEDGCPEPDNDGDGILDGDDRCPNQAEDGKEPWPEDGCPGSMRDSDGDEIFDDVDRCPMEPEDMDGFEDEDGCPDADNDGDGVADEDDRCPNCAGQDAEGCPVIELSNDVAHMEGDRLIIDQEIRFRGNALRSAGRKVVDQVAELIAEQPQVTSWMLVVGDARREQRAQARAEAIRDRLVSQGISADKIQVLAAVSQNPSIGLIAREREESEDGQPYCPEEYRAVPNSSSPATDAAREEPAAPEPEAE